MHITWKPKPPINHMAQRENQASPDTETTRATRRGLGLWDFAVAMTGGEASKELAEERLAICKQCEAVDSQGKPFYRLMNGKHYCGAPKTQKLLRDPVVDGCGCHLAFKVTKAKAACPLGKW